MLGIGLKIFEFLILLWNAAVAPQRGTPKTIYELVDLDVEENVRTLVSAGAVFRQGDNSNGDATANSLSALLRRVSGNSTREIDTLIGDLHDLREKLRADGERIHRDIVDYAALSQQ